MSSILQTDTLQGLRRQRVCLGPRNALQPQAPHHNTQHAGAKHVRTLKHHGLSLTRMRQDLPLGGRQQAVGHTQQGALARTIGADQGDTLTRLDGQLDVA